MQDVLLAIRLKRGTWDPSRPLGPWLTTLVRNKLIDSLRRRGRQTSVPIDDVLDFLKAADETNEAADRIDTETVLARLKEPQRDIVRALAIALGAGIILSALLLVATVGLRHNMASVFKTARVLFKITVTLVLAVLAARLAMRIGRPGEETRRPALLLALPAVMVTAAVVA